MAREVQQMFERIAPRYDLANRVMSLGVDPSWRRAAVRWLAPAPTARVLDVATGTGDLALALARAIGPAGRVVGCDFAREMLRRAPPKAAALRGSAALSWCHADALALPFGDAQFDGATIAFGIRNTDDPRRCLAEMRRVVRPGGAIVVLEFGQPASRWFAPLFRLYSATVLPELGGWITGQPAAYRYLPRTSAAFPCGEGFAAMMREAGLDAVGVRALSLGIAWLYRGIVS